MNLHRGQLTALRSESVRLQNEIETLTAQRDALKG